MVTKVIPLYEDRADVTLTAYVIAEKGEMNQQGPRPAVLICPGGGYMNCTDREAEPVALQFTAMGYHAFVLRYSTYGEGDMAYPDLSAPLLPKENCRHPGPVREIGMAMLSIREHAKEWFVDTSRIAVCGFSAGAHNAAMYGVYWDKPLITEYLNAEKEKLCPAALILGYTLSDYLYRNECLERSAWARIFYAARTVLSCSPQPEEEVLRALSPARLVTEHTPPAFIWATSEDKLVPVQHSLRMAHALADHKVPFEIHIFEKGSHGLSVSTQASALSKRQLSADAAKWVELAGCWLEKRFALELPDNSEFGKRMRSELQ